MCGDGGSHWCQPRGRTHDAVARGEALREKPHLRINAGRFSFRTLQVSRGRKSRPLSPALACDVRPLGESFPAGKAVLLWRMLAAALGPMLARDHLECCVLVAGLTGLHHYFKSFCSSSLNLLSTWYTYLSAFTHAVLK